MNPLITVLEASEEDKERVFELHCELFHDEIEDRWGWDEQWQKENFSKEWKRDDFEVVKHKDLVIGYLQFSKESDHIYLHNIALDPDFQGKGLGSHLLERIIKKAQKLCTVVELSVHPRNKVALKLYEKFDFEVIRSEPKTYLMRLNNKSLTRQVCGIARRSAPSNPTL